MDCTAAVSPISSSATAHLTSSLAPRLRYRFSALLRGQKKTRRRLLTLVAAIGRSHGPYSHDDDRDVPPPSPSSSFPSSSSSGRMVDEGMIVLRKRIRDMEMAEMNYEPPKDWADWERAYYTNYDSDVCVAVGLLQAYLLTTRPVVALGAAAVVACLCRCPPRP